MSGGNETKRNFLVLQQTFLPSLIGLTIFIVNLSAIFILVKSKTMNQHIRLMSVNLAFTDMMTGVAILVDSFLPLMLEEGLCRFLLYLYCIGVTVSFLTITGMLLDRFLALFYPFRYHTVIEKDRRPSIIFGLWMTGLLLTVVNFNDGFQAYEFQQFVACASYITVGRTGLTIVTVVFCFLIALDMVLYGLMLIKIHKISNSIACLETLTREKQFRSHARILIKLSTILGCFTFLYTPMIVLNIIDVSNTSPVLKKRILTWQSFTGFLILLNSLINPFLFVWRYTECRYTFLMIICHCSKHRREKYSTLKKQHFVSFLQPSSLNYPVSSDKE
ncbi:melanocyte-stimulating hormone receptor-like [Ostrea edulis]|uniref:melanocyte-stimulating hormone receptor-like n=1 Tax=Ostrea edulis TaxID=37623 RepID=UPI0024AF7351|nr:melanocyte-stimulating hormone receptor-like [Ostrea edulis]